MARTLNQATYTVKREAFVDAGLRLMQAKGYEQMSIQDVLDAVEASRGAFYHYFESKQALLEAMVDRIADQALGELTPTVANPRLDAITKLQAFFGGIARYKTQRKALMLEFIKVWKSHDNAIVRERLAPTLVKKVAPILAGIVRQGVVEEVFSVDSAEETATILMTLLMGFQDVALDLFLARQTGAISYEDAEGTLQSFTRAFERILAAPRGSIEVVDEATLREWFG